MPADASGYITIKKSVNGEEVPVLLYLAIVGGAGLILYLILR